MGEVVGLRNSSKHYLIYKITNIVTGETYIGQHQTYNVSDGYMGSGRLLKRKFEEYGVENFNKEILADFDNFEDMNSAEIRYIKELNPDYNISLGGESFVGINSVPGLNNKAGQCYKASKEFSRRLKEDASFRKKFSEIMSKANKEAYRSGNRKRRVFCDWSGRRHKEETKQKNIKIAKR